MAKENNMMIRTIIIITTTVVTILGVGVAVGVYRAEINNNSQSVNKLYTEVGVIKNKTYSNEKDIIKIQAAVDRTDERTGDIKEAVKRIEDKLNKEP